MEDGKRRVLNRILQRDEEEEKVGRTGETEGAAEAQEGVQNEEEVI